MTPLAPRERPAAYRPMRLLLTALAVLAVVALGIVAGKWQWGRYETRSDAAAAQDAAQGLPVVDLGTLLSPGDASAGDASWRTVTVTGVVDADSITAVRGRSIDGTPALQYIAWVDQADGTSVAINLGWEARDGAVGPVVPDGEVTFTGVARDLEPDNGREGTRIALAQLPSPNGAPLAAYVMARDACGAGGCVEGLQPVPEPSLSLGPHLSYAFQWWLLAAAAAPIAVLLTRRDARLDREGREASPPSKARNRRAQAGPTDEEIEDAL